MKIGFGILCEIYIVVFVVIFKFHILLISNIVYHKLNCTLLLQDQQQTWRTWTHVHLGPQRLLGAEILIRGTGECWSKDVNQSCNCFRNRDCFHPHKPQQHSRLSNQQIFPYFHIPQSNHIIFFYKTINPNLTQAIN